MKDINGEIQYKGKTYKMIFNLNVMEEIQEKYESIEKWGNLTSGEEPNVKALIFGFTAMLNEAIDIENEENETKIEPLTEKQVGRIITEIGFQAATDKMQKTVVDSTQSAEKNA
jgi:hypothetical protein